MELTIRQRVILVGILPKEGSILSLRVGRELKEALGFTDKERADLKIEEGPLGVKWNPEQNDYTADIDISDSQIGIIKQRFRELDREGKFPDIAFELWDLFME